MRPAVHFHAASVAPLPSSSSSSDALSVQPLLPAGHRVDRASLDAWTSACALALACVMAGTGDIECMRVLRYVRHPLEAEVQKAPVVMFYAASAAWMWVSVSVRVCSLK